MNNQVLTSLLVVLFFCFTSGRTPTGASPQCGTYTPANWVNDGETALLTTQIAAPLGTLYGAFFFGCTPKSVASQGYSFDFTYLDSAAPNNLLITRMSCEPNCGDSVATYDTTQGAGNLGVVSEWSTSYYNNTYGIEDYIIMSLTTIMYFPPEAEMIGEVESRSSKTASHHFAPRSHSLISKFSPSLASEDLATSFISETFQYDDYNRLRQISISTNFTKSDLTEDINYEVNSNDDIIEASYNWVGKNTTSQVFYTYNENREIVQICLESCDESSINYTYDSQGRIAGATSPTNQYHYVFVYGPNGQINNAIFTAYNQTSTFHFAY